MESEKVEKISGRCVGLVTGGSRGIGFEIVKKLYCSGVFSKIYFTSRAMDAGECAKLKIMADCAQEKVGTELVSLQLELQSSDSIDTLISKVSENLDVVIHNAGIMLPTKVVNEVIITQTLATNMYGPKTLTEKLLNMGKLNKCGVIVFVSSKLGEREKVAKNNKNFAEMLRNYDGRNSRQPMNMENLTTLFTAYEKDIRSTNAAERKQWPNSVYAVSKLFLSLYAFVLSREKQITDLGIKVISCCLGWCQTDLTKGSNAQLTAAQGADTPAYLALEGLGDRSGELTSGGFYFEKKLTEF